MDRKHKIDFILVTVFAGILLTFAAIIGVGSAIGSDYSEDISFNRRFHSDNAIVSFVRYVDYKVFGHINENDLLIGKDDWLFEAVDSENGYERLLDYIGGSPFDAEELEKIANNISDRVAAYKKEGIEYMMIIIPDSITVCSDMAPWYLGDQSENTRLSQLTEYMNDRGINAFINPVEAMLAESERDGLVMYNNTENSINAYGAYCVYNTAVSRYLASTGREVERIYRDDITFYTRLTEGKKIAQLAGLENTIQNKTVSISDGMKEDFTLIYNEKDFTVTRRAGLEDDEVKTCVVVEYTDDWDRIQLMPYFSNTFDTVYYRGRLMEQPSTSAQYGAMLVVQIIHESELDMLLE